MTFDKYSFDETRYINQLIDYEHFKKSKSRISRLYVPQGSPLSLYKKATNNGVLKLYDAGSKHVYKISIKDLF